MGRAHLIFERSLEARSSIGGVRPAISARHSTSVSVLAATVIVLITSGLADAGPHQRRQHKRRPIPVRLVSPGDSRLPQASPPPQPEAPNQRSPALEAGALEATPVQETVAGSTVAGSTSNSQPLTEAVDRPEITDLQIPRLTLPSNASGPGSSLSVAEVNGGAGNLTMKAGSNLTATTVTPTLDGKHAAATAASTRPVLDGRVDEPVWRTADAVTDFLQKDPVAGAAPSQRTEVRVLYDEDNLYFGWILYDNEPEKIVGTELRRDAYLDIDDFVTLFLDTFHDHRNTFIFQVNALGTKSDYFLRDESQFNANWDESWEAAAHIGEHGWEVEIAIPFAVLRYPTGSHVWGVEFERGISRTNELIHWNNTGRDYDWRGVSQFGHLLGLDNLKLTDRFRFKPFVTGAYDSFQQRGDPTSQGNGEFGIEVFKVQLTPNLTTNLTANTDFAQVEADDQQVNLTRFSLFFPEKREFFLESANSFVFGTLARRGASTESAGGGFSRQPPLALLFFSRRIGLGPDGEPLPIRFGGKLTGKVGSGNLGFVNVQTGDSLFGVGKNYSALRWKQDVFDRSSIGALVTNVQGPDGEFNRVFGIDADFTLFDHLFVSGFIAGGQDDAVQGSSWVGQLGAGWDTDKWGASGDITYVDEDFDTELGFILRRDIIRQSYQARWSPRPNWEVLRRLSVSASLEHITDTTGRLVSRRSGISSGLQFESGDSLTVKMDRNFERLDFDFPIDENVGIPVGDHAWTDGQIGLRTAGRRWLGGGIRVNLGEFYNGNRFGIGGGPRIRFSQRFSLEPQYSYNHIRLPGGTFSTHLLRARTNLSFSDRFLVDTLLQHSTVTDQLSLFARLRYIYRTGDDFYLVYRQSTALGGLFDRLDDRSLTAKMTYAFQW